MLGPRKNEWTEGAELAAPVLRRAPPQPARAGGPGRPPQAEGQAEGLPHRRPQIPDQKKVLTGSRIRSKVLTDWER
jgi:hypothetical protein